MSEDGVREQAEAWFHRHGLPYFVEDVRADVERSLERRRVVGLAAVALVVGALAGATAGLLDTDVSSGVLAGMVAAGLVALAYGVARLRVGSMARWALAHTFGSLGLLFPLVTRALPLLLLFVTFLFINAEVWQVATSLDGGVLWVAVLLFAGVAVGFLLVRLPEELDRVDHELSRDRLIAACEGTPVAGVADRLLQVEPDGETDVRGYPRGNLLFVLLVSQAVQVLLLAVAVYAFFVVFGAVAMKEEVVLSWVGGDDLTWFLGSWHIVSLELLQVSTFLAAFSGLYFTVYAVSDETYRTQFFASLVTQLERAVAVNVVYRRLLRRSTPE